jgi:hypothetical protein
MFAGSDRFVSQTLRTTCSIRHLKFGAAGRSGQTATVVLPPPAHSLLEHDTILMTHNEKRGSRDEQDLERGEQGTGVPSETATLEAPAGVKENAEEERVNGRDFGLVPIPKHLRFAKESPPKFDIVLNVLFGIACTFGAYLVLTKPGLFIGLCIVLPPRLDEYLEG